LISDAFHNRLGFRNFVFIQSLQTRLLEGKTMMSQGRLHFVAIAWIVLGVLTLPSCGFKRQLVSITLIPNLATLTGFGVQLQFKAVGNYIHPPDSRDITTSVVWQSAAPQVVTVDATGLATSGPGCGTGIVISATAHNDPHDNSSGIVVGTAAVTVNPPPPATCP